MEEDKVNEYKLTDAEVADFKRFWESDAGKKYMKKLKHTREELSLASMGSVDRDDIVRYSLIANGVESVLQDIEMTIKAKNEKEKEAKKTAKK